MKLINKTKKQIIGILIETELKLNAKIELVDNLVMQKKDLINENFNQGKLIQDQKEAFVSKSIENIADIKSIKDMLQPFIDETMTHREKKYLGRYFDLILKKKIEKKLNSLDFNYKYKTDLPF